MHTDNCVVAVVKSDIQHPTTNVQGKKSIKTGEIIYFVRAVATRLQCAIPIKHYLQNRRL
jgi:hypothetical protein